MELVEEIKVIQKDVNYRRLKIRGGNNAGYDFIDYRTFKELFRDLYNKEWNTTINEIERKQDESSVVMTALKNYTPRNNKYVEAKNKLLNNVENFYKGREKNIEGFKNKIFPLYYDKEYEYKARVERREEIERRRKKEKKKNKKNKKNKIKKQQVWINLMNGLIWKKKTWSKNYLKNILAAFKDLVICSKNYT